MKWIVLIMITLFNPDGHGKYRKIYLAPNAFASFSIRSKNNSMNMRGRTPKATFMFGAFFS